MRKFSFIACAIAFGTSSLVADLGSNSHFIKDDTILTSTNPSYPLLAQNEVDNAALFDQNGEASTTYKLDKVEINSVGDDISESGISEGFLNKGIASGPLDNQKAMDVPYQVNTITREMLDNQGVQTFDQAVKYFPSAQLQYRGGPEMGRPQTRGFQGSVVGNSFWDGFYSVSTTAIPFAMFESLQVQNGLAGTLYGGQAPAGIFSYQRKRPIKDYISIWGDFTSSGHFGVGIDGSDKNDRMGFRGVLYTADGNREPQENNINRNLASFALDFYAAENLTLETNFSYYKHISKGHYNGVTAGAYEVEKVPASTSERFMRTTTASAKVKYLPFSFLYLEGGYQWQEAVRSRATTGQAGFTVPSWFIKAQSEFETGSVSHDLSLSVNAYKWLNASTHALMSDMRNVGLLYDVGFGEHFDVFLSAANSWFKNDGYNKTGLSYAASFMVKPLPDRLHFYATYADSLEEGAAHYYDPSAQVNNTQKYQSSHPLYGQIVHFEPYRSKQYEIGLKAVINQSFDLSLALFQIQRPSYYEYNLIFDKQGEQRNRGLELMVGGKFNQYLSTYGGVTFLDAKMADSSVRKEVEGKRIIGEPKIQANVLFDFIVPDVENLAFFTNLHYTHRRYANELNTMDIPSYFTMDLGARFSVKNVIGKETIFRFNISNLLDKKYWVGAFPQAAGTVNNGQNVSIGANSGSNVFRGYDRTFSASVMVKF